jgi:hypothetical protein
VQREYEELTVQFGDRTFWGEYAVADGFVFVRAAEGAKMAPQPLLKPLVVAERLLLEINREAGKL